MAIYTKITESQIQKILKNYPLSKPTQIQGVKEGTVNTYYLLHIDGDDYFLKVDEVACKKRLKKELKILDFLAKKEKQLGFKAPRAIKTLKNESFIPYGQKSILIFPRIHGCSLFDQDLKTNHLTLIGEKLAIMHQLSSKSLKVSTHRFSTTELKRIFHTLKPKLIKKGHEALIPFIAHQLRNLPSFQKLPHSLIHADLFSENILFNQNKISGILDFEAAGLGPCLFDICVTLHALCITKGNFNLRKVKAFLNGYQNKRKLKTLEKEVFLDMLNLTALRFLLTRLRDFELNPTAGISAPVKDYKEFVKRFDQNKELAKRLSEFL